MTELEYIVIAASDVRKTIERKEKEIQACERRIQEYEGTCINPKAIMHKRDVIQKGIDFEFEKLQALGAIKEMLEACSK